LVVPVRTFYLVTVGIAVVSSALTNVPGNMSAPSAGEKDPSEPIELLDDDSDGDNDVPQAVRAGDVIVLGNAGRVIFLDSDDEVIEIDDSEEKTTAHAAQQDDESAKSDRDKKLPAVVASKQEPCAHAEAAPSSDDESAMNSGKLPVAVALQQDPCAHAKEALSSDDESAMNSGKLPAAVTRQQGLCSRKETHTEAPEQRSNREVCAPRTRENGVPIRKSSRCQAWDCDEDEIVAPGDVSGQGDSGDDHPKTDSDAAGLCAQHQEQLVFHLNTEFEWRQNQQRSVRATYVVRFQCGLLLLRTPLLFPFGAPMSYRQ
jgi:hypothetical protein